VVVPYGYIRVNVGRDEGVNEMRIPAAARSGSEFGPLVRLSSLLHLSILC